MNVFILFVLASTAAFAPSKQWTPRRAPPLRMMAAPAGVSEAFAKVKAAAELFSPGTDSAKSASSIIERLELSSVDSWQKQDLELIDSCLVDEQGPGCGEFVSAMTELRELWDASPGNA